MVKLIPGKLYFANRLPEVYHDRVTYLTNTCFILLEVVDWPEPYQSRIKVLSSGGCVYNLYLFSNTPKDWGVEMAGGEP